MGQLLLFLVIGLTAAAIVFGVVALITGRDPGLVAAEPDGRAAPLPTSRPLAESDVDQVRFDTVLRGYRMSQVDQALRRAAYDIGYKDELIGVLEAEVVALREGRTADAEALRQVREAALSSASARSVNAAGPRTATGSPASSDSTSSVSTAPGATAPGSTATGRSTGAATPPEETDVPVEPSGGVVRSEPA